MSSLDVELVKALFDEAVDKSSIERDALLTRGCGGDATLRAEVEALLSASDRAGDFLSLPSADSSLDVLPGEEPGAIVGPYVLLRLLGEGGFGRVFLAEQHLPIRRKVALKIIKLGMDTRQVIARFEAERQALAMLNHPNVARVFDAGATETGRPFFAMEWVEGQPITKFCEASGLSLRQKLDLFVQICNAVQHAHQNGIIHRDLKPSNLLVAIQDDKPVAKVIDFGIAKAISTPLTDKTMFTEARQMIGTPEYMSPEQAQHGDLGIDSRSDIYSLGVVLYELLTGTTPLDGMMLRQAGYAEMLKTIGEAQPTRPSSRLLLVDMSRPGGALPSQAERKKQRKLIRCDLDWITLKALEKDRARRYQSASELARDIERHLRDEPVEARPPSIRYQLGKFARRHKAGISTALVFIIAVSFFVVLYIHSIRLEQRKTAAALVEVRNQQSEAEREREEADQASGRARHAEIEAQNDFVQAAIAQARGGILGVQAGHRFDSLRALSDAARISPTVDVRSQAAACMGLADLNIEKKWTTDGDALDFNHELTAYADSRHDEDVVIRQVPPLQESGPGKVLLTIPGHIVTGHVKFSPDDQLLAVSFQDHHVRVYSMNGAQILDIAGGPGCDFTPDGTGIAVADFDGHVALYDLRTGAVRRRFAWPECDGVVFSPDGRKLALWHIYRSADIAIGDINSGRVGRIKNPSVVFRIAWHPNSKLIAASSVDWTTYLWNVPAVDEITPAAALHGHQSDVFDAEFSHDGDLIATTSWDRTVRLWDAHSGEERVRLFATGLLRFASDDQQVAISGFDGTHLLVRVATDRECPTFSAPREYGRQISFTPDGLLMAGGGAGGVRIWNLTEASPNSCPLDLPIPGVTRSAAFSPDGTCLIAATDEDLWRIPIDAPPMATKTPAESAVRRIRIGAASKLAPGLFVLGNNVVQISGDGTLAALAREDREPLILKLRQPSRRIALEGCQRCMFIAISPDAKWVATGTRKGLGDHRVGIWDANAGMLVRWLPVKFDADVAFSPDNRWLVTATSEEYRFWEVGTWLPGRSLARDAEYMGYAVFSPDTRILAISHRQGGVRLVDIASGKELVTLNDFGDQVPIGFSPDGSRLITRAGNETLRVWNLLAVRKQLKQMGLDWGEPLTPSPRQSPAAIVLETDPP